MDQLLKRLSEALGVSGCENEVRTIIQQEAEPYADHIHIDNIGNLIAFKKGSAPKKHIMLAAHMDEVGLIVTQTEDNGTLRFQCIGGIDPRVLLAKRVVIGKDKIPGIIGVKAIHLQSQSERGNTLPLTSLYIDTGADSKDKTGVSLGDAVAFDTQCTEFGDGCVKGKALDDRLGCYVLLQLMKNSYQDDISFCFTVQEEVGLRGAYVAAYTVRPDIALVCESTTCADVPGVEETAKVTLFRKGPAVSFMDAASIGSKKLVADILDTAQQNSIPHQIKMGTSGGNDAGAIATSLEGVPTVVVSIPTRYIHSPVSAASMEDIEHTIQLMDAYLRRN